jgi:nucleoid-associated protein YgaU
MPNDAKLAMMIGVGLVVAVAIVFFHKDLVKSRGPDDRPPTNGVNAPTPPSGSGNTRQRPLAAHPTARIALPAGLRRHTIAAGDTLYELAERYYGDGEHFVELYRANRDVLNRPDRLTVGTVLVIPELADTTAP